MIDNEGTLLLEKETEGYNKKINFFS